VGACAASAEVCCVLATTTTVDTIHLHGHIFSPIIANLLATLLFSAVWLFDSTKHSEAFRQSFVVRGLLTLHQLVLLHLSDDLPLQIVEGHQVGLELGKLLLLNPRVFLKGPVLLIFDFPGHLRALTTLGSGWLTWTGQTHEALRQGKSCPRNVVFYLPRCRAT